MTLGPAVISSHRPFRRALLLLRLWTGLAGTTLSLGLAPATTATTAAVNSAEATEITREARRVLSENCFGCHGPDAKARKSGRKVLRLDLPESARADLGNGRPAIVPGRPAQSELIRRITTPDPDDHMPPADSGKKLGPREIALLKKWIEQGAEFARHWSYVPPQRPVLPRIHETAWPRNPVDHFILARLEKEKLKHAPEADRAALARRVSLDLTGLPPTLPEVERFLADREPGAYERWVDRLLGAEAYGEHWARLWLDQARYADSSGYADDPARTIWAYRDYLIQALNSNRPFDQFTLEQLAGDLLDDPTDEQLVATAFHRNTMTNNEGGTSDEEYRNVAVVDRVNTTMAVWMGTTMGCAQCHNHKYDPISQEDYFRLFAVLNNTADADRGDESPVLPLYTAGQKLQRKGWQAEIVRLEHTLRTPTPALTAAQAAWEARLAGEVAWQPWTPSAVTSKAGAAITRHPESTATAGRPDEVGIVQFARGGKTDVYTLELPINPGETIRALRLETLPTDLSAPLPVDPAAPATARSKSLPGVGHGDGNFVLSRVQAVVAATDGTRGRFAPRHLRVELPGGDRILSLAEVQVFSGSSNLALRGEARQSSTAYDGPARLAIDGNTSGDFAGAKSTTHTESSKDPWWELDLKTAEPIDRIVLWNRTDGSGDRLAGARVRFLDEKRETLWQGEVPQAPNPSLELRPDGGHLVKFASATADFSQKEFNAARVLDNKDPKDPKSQGWAVSPKLDEPHFLTLIPQSPLTVGAGSNLVVTLEQLSTHDHATLAKIRLLRTADERAPELALLPAAALRSLRTSPASARTDGQRQELTAYYLSIAPALQAEREQLAEVKKKLEEAKPYTTVPILKELAGNERRKTHIQRRGNFLDLGKETTEGLPPALLSSPDRTPIDRLALARWLVSTNNPLTARVVANRLWESIFGIGLVRTSEEFGAQGEPPSHPELLDWLAVELMEHRWDVKHVLRQLVTSAAYRQSSRVPAELAARDPENRLLARGPRFRLSAEMVRDQALTVSGLLSPKMYGPPVRPPQPKLGLAAAFGSGTDWEPSSGEDSHRRALYTTWRRSNPYPSMATFDAPNREVCLVRRERSNTPLQALVTLNDPVYVEAAQALARKMAAAGGTPADRARHGFRLCLSRPPTAEELQGLLRLFTKTRPRYESDPAKARTVAGKFPGDAPQEAELAELAAWTVVGNVLLNLDEMLMKR